MKLQLELKKISAYIFSHFDNCTLHNNTQCSLVKNGNIVISQKKTKNCQKYFYSEMVNSMCRFMIENEDG